ncbi:MAG TPA: DUF1989 domain-containing protein [Thiomonas arsenitoxydans]|jgi:uncharacterized protein YcgI (DUF1989 family)|nr:MULTISPECIES: DUF1989 domain-containing protein [Thiomonas]OYV30113.1 MAG: urea carboxylase [Thiomonas sp. 20-64-9]OZB55675.1 MAG: urea carboxylase [Thiomonas sp. 15-63-373]OZB69700.1 MAG: urea carboxylase [Thiomonas sp. 13-64-67]CAZ90274.1 conserved hypothetical protein [Thiomonas arsenitoxydans]CQR40889.1 conserved hypothetical protein [Thiomonas arsenitoxydans]
MSSFNLVESPLDPAHAIYDHVLPAGEGWLHPVHAGQTLRILDLEGNQAVDTLFYSASDLTERYSATETLKAGAIYLTAGSRLMSSRGREMLTITADTCGRHDTLGGACSAESNAVRYALNKQPMHSCRDTFLKCLWQYDSGLSRECGAAPNALDSRGGRAEPGSAQGALTKRDLTANINFFMNVPVTPEGGLEFADGVSAPGKYVEMKAAIDVLCLISNCPQLNNPCNAYNPTPVRLLIWN